MKVLSKILILFLATINTKIYPMLATTLFAAKKLSTQTSLRGFSSHKNRIITAGHQALSEGHTSRADRLIKTGEELHQYKNRSEFSRLELAVIHDDYVYVENFLQRMKNQSTEKEG